MFSSRLCELRKNRGLTQQTLADVIEVSQQTVAQWEKGSREPNLEKLIALAKLFGVTLDYLVGVESYSANSTRIANEVELTDKRDVRLFLEKLYSDTISKKITWKRYYDRFPADLRQDEIMNLGLSFATDLERLNAIVILFYSTTYSLLTTRESALILPEIRMSDGSTFTLPSDAGTSKMLKKIYSAIDVEMEAPKSVQMLTNFIYQYLEE